jgi:hypothetical protein
MRTIFLLLFIYLPNILLAKTDQKYRLTRCLGNEELRLHKSSLGNSQYFLNQIILGEILLLKNVTLKDQYYQQVCENNPSPSLEILKLMLYKKTEIFKILSSDSLEIQMNTSLISNLISKLPDIFNQYILNISKLSPHPHCLNRYIPEIFELQEKLGYLSSHMPISKIMDINSIDKIFFKLNKIGIIFRKCQKEIKRKST